MTDITMKLAVKKSTTGRVLRFLHSLSVAGILLGTLFFSASLTPSLIPRTFLMQGALSGACFAIGYALGVGCRSLWRYMQLPEFHRHLDRWLKIAALGLSLVVAVTFLSKATAWQNSIHIRMKMDPVHSAHPLEVGGMAILVFIALVMIGRLFNLVVDLIARRANRLLNPRISRVLGMLGGLTLFWFVANGVLVRYTLYVLDSSFAAFDELFEPDRSQPKSPLQTGSSASLMTWEDLGRTGRRFVSSGPSAEDIAAFTGQKAMQPLRVYASLRNGESAENRAEAAFEELKRVGGFERSVLVVITPTGTGWIDPAAIDSVEYLHSGDIASVALQYSYLSSPLSLLVEPEYGVDAARALFTKVYSYWTKLPHDRRPKLYLHGLSLGALNSERSAELFEILADPIQGALWSGPPFASRIWRRVTDARNAGSPEWLPEFRDGSIFRFMNQNGSPTPVTAGWGPMRIVYLQYASDPITFFNYRDFYRRPDWLSGVRGPDVSADLRWFPIVTALQLAVDMMVANSAPRGFGHVYAAEHYITAWLTLTAPEGWDAGSLERLAKHLSENQD